MITHAVLDSLSRAYKGFVGPEPKAHPDTVAAYRDQLARLVFDHLPGLIEIASKSLPAAHSELMTIRVPGLVPTGTKNSREHWAVRAKRVRRERALVAMRLVNRKPPAPPLKVTIIRCSPRLIADDDNATTSGSAVRDELARWLRVDDRDKRVKWVVEQMKCKRVDRGVLIRIEGVGK